MLPPMPRPAPVTTATLPVKVMMLLSFPTRRSADGRSCARAGRLGDGHQPAEGLRTVRSVGVDTDATNSKGGGLGWTFEPRAFGRTAEAGAIGQFGRRMEGELQGRGTPSVLLGGPYQGRCPADRVAFHVTSDEDDATQDIPDVGDVQARAPGSRGLDRYTVEPSPVDAAAPETRRTTLSAALRPMVA